MDTSRSWLHKFHPRDRLKSNTRRRESMADGEDSNSSVMDEEVSNITKQKVVAAKKYIENHYKEQMKNLQERRERQVLSEKKLADGDVSEEDQNNLLRNLQIEQEMETVVKVLQPGPHTYRIRYGGIMTPWEQCGQVFKELQAWENTWYWFIWKGENCRACFDRSQSCYKDP